MLKYVLASSGTVRMVSGNPLSTMSRSCWRSSSSVVAQIICPFLSEVTGSASTNECTITSTSSERSLFSSAVLSASALESVSAKEQVLAGYIVDV